MRQCDRHDGAPFRVPVMDTMNHPTKERLLAQDTSKIEGLML
jgi:hypothetical protein